MPSRGLESELPPLSEALTENIRVEVISRYVPENSRPTESEWVFEYTVRITNQGRDTVQLLSRHWVITDAAGFIREVEGAGVVGQQPVLAPGESFKYSSWCPLATPSGSMRGTYTLTAAGRGDFQVEIGAFGLRAKH